MRILALDASISSTGYATYDMIERRFMKVGRIRTTKKKVTPTHAKRIEQICIEISHVMFWEEIDIVLIEDIFIHPKLMTASSVIPLAMLRGAIQETVYGLEHDDLWVAETKKIKKAVAGSGNASKFDVYNTLKEKYKDCPIVMEALGDELIDKGANKNEDMSDAIALIDGYINDPSIVHPA